MKHLLSAIFALVLCSAGSSAQDMKPAGRSKAIRDAEAYAQSGHYLGDDKIMGGSYAVKGDNPWQVALVLASTSDSPRHLFCGGSMVSKTMVITAAHCVDEGTTADAVDVIAGAMNVAKDGRRVKVRSIWIDPDYGKGQPRAHDVAILKLAEDVSTLAPAIELADAADDSFLREKFEVRVTGWGAPSKDGGAVRDLRTVDLMVISNDRCNDPVVYDGAVGASMMCAGWPNGERNSCQGDSGSPLSGIIRGRRRLVGIVSWGRNCSVIDKYGVYARIPALDWAKACAADQSQCTENKGNPT